MLSPFQVDATKEKGYFAENTLAGSRMRTNISDLGAAISVVTKQQMEDTASLDVNDIFRYEINAEGSATYTPVVANQRGNTGYADTIGGNSRGGTGATDTNATSNRVRGLVAPSMALNYYSALSQVPFDSYNTASVEINRGPNSMLFGMGSPAGIVNQSTASAEIGKNNASAQIRVDDRGSSRASLSFNKTLVGGKLAVYGALLYNDQQFERKPSYDITRRQYGAITYKPFKGTTLRANIEGYTNDNRRPNFMTPRDFVSDWLKAGSPYYDPRAGAFIKGDGTIVPYVGSASSPLAPNVWTWVQAQPGYDSSKLSGNNYNGVSLYTGAAITNPNSIMYIPGIAIWVSRPFQMLDGGNSAGFYEPTATRVIPRWTSATTSPAAPSEADIWANPTWASAYNQQWTRSIGASELYASTLSNFVDPGVTDKAIYDWSKTNINQMNFGEARNTTYNLELEQEILPGLLHFTAGWFRQDYDSVVNYTVSQLDAATLYVDTNKYLPTGEANPYFGKVYLEDTDPDTWEYGITSDQYRAMLAFTPDFTQNKGWTKWLGRHNILGLVSHQKTTSTTIRQRLMFIDAEAGAESRYLPNPYYSGGAWSYADGHNGRVNRREDGQSVTRLYYLSSPGDTNGQVTHASGQWAGATSYTGGITGYDFNSSSWRSYNMTLGLVPHSASTTRNERELMSYSAGITSYFWDDRIITTLGVRRDENKTRIAKGAGMTDAEKFIDGYYQVGEAFSHWTKWKGVEWDEVSGTTSTMGIVVKPFLHREEIEKRAATGNLFWEFVRDFGLSYNRSDNFDAPAETYVDFFGNHLPKQTGTGKDYGVQFSLFKNKLFARVSWFDATNENALANPGNAVSRIQSLIDTTAFRAWAEQIVLLNHYTGDPTTVSNADMQAAARATMTNDQLRSEIAAIWGQDYDYYGNLPGTIYTTQSQEAKGVELQLTYNPLPNWTMRLTAGKQKSTYNNVLKEFDAWYAHRSEIWKNAKAVDYLNPGKQQYASYTPLGATNPINLTGFWTNSSGYRSEYGPDNANGYRTAEDYYNGVVTPEVALAQDLQGQISPGQRKYRAAFVTNYNFTRGALKGFGVGGGQRWEDKAIIGYYGRPTGENAAYPNKLERANLSCPMYDSANWYTDLWISYTRKILNDKVRMKLQLNVVDVFEDGGLRVVARDYEGRPKGYRIVDPRTFILTATFDF
jgi:hypothetical protein